MLSLSATNSKLFQLWNPAALADLEAPAEDWFVELPLVENYQQLLCEPVFQDIHSDFLGNIEQLRQLAHKYVGDQYDQALGVFINKLSYPHESDHDQLIPLYRETRYHIYQLVSQLRAHQGEDAISVEEGRSSLVGDNAIAMVLHRCLDKIDLCMAAVHSRFATGFIDVKSLFTNQFDGTLYKIRDGQFQNFVHNFMVQEQRNGADIAQNMEVHWFNGLYNLYCQELALHPVIDSLAVSYLNDNDKLERYLASARLSVNTFTVLHEVAAHFSRQLVAILADIGCSHWLSGPTGAEENTAIAIEALESRFFGPINSKLGNTDNPLDLTEVMDCITDDSFHLERHWEKIFAWLTCYFCGTAARIFAITGHNKQKSTFIGTVNEVYFWAFEPGFSPQTGSEFPFDSGRCSTLRLSHLDTIDFSTWPELTAIALLAQAMIQTTEATEIADFFFNARVSCQLRAMADEVMRMLSVHLQGKLASADDGFKQSLCQCACDHVVSIINSGDDAGAVSSSIRWLVDTPLLELVLSRLHNQGINIAEVMVRLRLNSWEVAGFSLQHIKELLNPECCQRLLRQAYRLRQTDLLVKLVISGHCLNFDRQARMQLVAGFRHRDMAGLLHLQSLALEDINCRFAHDQTLLHHAITMDYQLVARVLLNLPGINVNTRDKYGETPLTSAIDKDDLLILSALLKVPDIDVNMKIDNCSSPGYVSADGVADGHVDLCKDDSKTPLMIAASRGNPESVKALLSVAGIDVNATSSQGWTALCRAVQMNNSKCVRELLSAKAIQVNLPVVESGSTPLYYAAEGGHLECLKELLAVPCVAVNRANKRGSTPLHIACRKGHDKCIEELLKRPEIAINVSDVKGFTPLHLVAFAGQNQLRCLKLLLGRQEVCASTYSICGNTPLDFFVSTGSLKCAAELLKVPGIDVNQPIRQPLILVSTIRQDYPVSITRDLLRLPGINVNVRDSRGWTPLHHAVDSDRPECVKALLRAPGIAPDVLNLAGKTPLSFAARSGRYACVQALLEVGLADVNLASLEGETPLHSAVIQDHLDCVIALLKVRDIDVNRATVKGKTALDYAVSLGRFSCLQELLKVPGINVNQSFSPDQMAPLHRAASKGFYGCLKLLLKVPGIKVNQRCRNGFTPLHLAASRGHLDCLRALLVVPAIQVDLACNNGVTPAQSAQRNGHLDCLDVLRTSQLT